MNRPGFLGDHPSGKPGTVHQGQSPEPFKSPSAITGERTQFGVFICDPDATGITQRDPLSGGCNRYMLVGESVGNPLVSILTHPYRRVQPGPDVGSRFTTPMFQSSPAPEGECNPAGRGRR